MVLSNGSGHSPLLAREVLEARELFGGSESSDLPPQFRYRVTDPAGWSSLDFISLYKAIRA